jgi:hypothetical protein
VANRADCFFEDIDGHRFDEFSIETKITPTSTANPTPVPVPYDPSGCRRAYDAPSSGFSPQRLAKCGTSCCRGKDGSNACYYTADDPAACSVLPPTCSYPPYSEGGFRGDFSQCEVGTDWAGCYRDYDKPGSGYEPQRFAKCGTSCCRSRDGGRNACYYSADDDNECADIPATCHYPRYVDGGFEGGNSECVSGSGSSLPWGDINIITTTDIHGWYSLNRRVDGDATPADLGDLYSLVFWLKEQARQRGVDIIVADTGDYIDGTGLSDITKPPSGELMWPLLLRMGEYDILGLGNHELYLNETVESMATGLWSKCGEACVSSNAVWADSLQPLTSRRYHLIVGENSGKRVLAMGFIYDMQDHCEAVQVVSPEDSVKEAWFAEAMATERIDAIVVTVHMDRNSRHIDFILSAIRAHHPTIPVVFPSGHTHTRAFARKDDHAASVQAGANFQVEWASFQLLGGNPTARTWFDFEYLDPSVEEFARVAGFSSDPAGFATAKGTEISREIKELRKKWGLDEVVGCASIEYSRSAAVGRPESVWGLYLQEVLPFALFDNTRSHQPLLIEATGSFRANLREGTVSVDDVYIMNPFKNTYYSFEGLDGTDVSGVMQSIGARVTRGANTHVQHYPSADGHSGAEVASLPSWVASVEPSADTTYDLICTNFDLPRCEEAVLKVTGSAGTPKRYTTGGEELDSSDLWFRYIRAKWPCLGAADEGKGTDTPTQVA